MESTKINYKCLRCNYDFKSGKTHLMRHLKRKNICESTNFDIERNYLIELLNNNEYIEYYKSYKNKKKCIYCSKIFIRNNLKRHQKTCKLNPDNIKKDSNDEIEELLKSEKATTQIINNTTNIQNNNNINIHINSFGNESYDIKKITKELKFVLGYSNFNGNELQFEDRIDNMISNYNVIFDHLYDNPENHNFDIINKKDKICKIKDDEDNFKHIKFDELINKIFDIITNVFDLSILEFEINNDNKSLYHYKEFKKNLLDRKNKFIIKYQNAESTQEKNNIKMALFKYYKGFRDIIDNIKDKIILKAYDFDL